MENKPYAIAVRIYESNGITMADIKTSLRDGLGIETITWTKPNERESYTLIYDERIKDIKPFEEIK